MTFPQPPWQAPEHWDAVTPTQRTVALPPGLVIPAGGDQPRKLMRSCYLCRALHPRFRRRGSPAHFTQCAFLLDYMVEHGVSIAQARRETAQARRAGRLRQLWAERPELFTKNREGARTPEGREQRRRQAIACWARPEYRENWKAAMAAGRAKWLEAIRTKRETPEFAAKRKANSVAMWRDPVRRAEALRKQTLTMMARYGA